MVNKTASTGNWETSGTWSPSGAPGPSDQAIIPNGVTVTTTVTDDVAYGVTIQAGGKLRLGAGLTLKIVNGIDSQASGSLISLGTAANACIIDRYAAPATWFMVLTAPGSDTNLDFLWLKNNLYCLGYDTSNMVLFNSLTIAASAWINNVTPLTRAPVVIKHAIDGRAYGRTYRRGSQAGVVTISGFLYHSTFDFQTIKNLQALTTGLCLTTERIHLPYCSIDGDPRYNPRPGQLYCPFSLTLIEDR